MRKLILILPAILLLTGCSSATYMTNDEVIFEVKKCEDAGLKAEIWGSARSGKASAVYCRIK